MASNEGPSIGCNTVFGGNAGTTSTGIEAIGAFGNSPIILCTIDGGIGSSAIGIRVSGGSELPGFANDIIFVSGSTASAWCIDLSGVGNIVSQMRNNDLWDRTGSTVLYRDAAGIEFDSESAVNGVDNGISGNVSTDPFFVDIDGPDGSMVSMGDNDWQLTAATPVNVRQGGLDMSKMAYGWELDKNHVERTDLTEGPNDNPSNGGEGWSMGAYEKD